MNTQPNKPFDLNSLSDLYEKASEARFQLLKERHELVTNYIKKCGKRVNISEDCSC